MLEIEKLRGDLREQDAVARHHDRMFLLESRRTNIAYMASGASLLAGGAAGLIGALPVIFNATFKSSRQPRFALAAAPHDRA